MKAWVKHTEEIYELLNDYLEWNHTGMDRCVVEQIKSFVFYESLMEESEENNNNFLDGQTQFTNIEGEIEVIGN